MTNRKASSDSDVNTIIFHIQRTEKWSASKVDYVKRLADRFDAEVQIYLEQEANEAENSNTNILDAGGVTETLNECLKKQLPSSQAYATLVAESEKVDLLVTGTSSIGHAEYPEFFFSTMQLAKDAACPVMLVPHRMRKLNNLSLNKPVVICSSGEDVVGVMDSILPFLKESWVSILFSHYQSYNRGVQELRKKHDLADFLQANDINCQLVIPEERASQDLDGLVSEINNGQYDFVIMRAYGRSSMRDLFLGLLPRAIISRAQLPVLLTG